MTHHQKQSKLKLLLSFSKGYRLTFIFAMLSAISGLFFSFVTPQILKVSVDSIIGNTPIASGGLTEKIVLLLGGKAYLSNHLYLIGLSVVLLSALSGLFVFLRVYLVSFTAEGVTKHIRDSLFDHILALPFSYHTQNNTGDLVQRCTSDVETVRTFIEKQVAEVFRITVLALFSSIIMLALNVKLAVAAILFLPVMLVYSVCFHRYIGKYYLQGDEAEGMLTSTVQENLSGVRVVRAFGREREALHKFDEHNEKFANIWVGIMGRLSLFWSSADLYIALQTLVITVVAAFLAKGGELTLGTFIAFYSYNAMIAWPIRSLGRILADMSKANVSFKRIKEIFDAEEETEEAGALTPPLNKDIVFSHVTFAYPDGRRILDDVSFTVKAGETAAFLGATGCGKSTIVHILCRFYDIESGCGSVTIGGVDIRRISRKYLRRNIGIVLQEPFLYSKTIQENIRITKPAVGFESITQAAAAASIDKNIRQFSEGYDTIVGERGVTLSGGQKQRISIARILVKKNQILIFDDSMSAVDTSTEIEIRNALKQQCRGATSIYISHRISTLMQADRIIVLEDGKVAENGSHAELLAKNGIYKRIYIMQSSFDSELKEKGGTAVV